MHDKIIGKRVREIRKSRNLSQAQLGNVIGISKQAISKIESGKTKTLSNANISSLASYLDCNKEYLTGELDTTGKNSETGKALEQPMWKDAFYRPVAQMHEHLDRAEQDFVVQFLNKVIEIDEYKRASLKQVMPVVLKLMTANDKTVVLIQGILDVIIENVE